jgi:hypothetical protein
MSFIVVSINFHIIIVTVKYVIPESLTQGNRIWIFHSRIAGHEVDSGGIGGASAAENHCHEGNVKTK